jgi:predicted O-methyltransferase YrrM
MLKSLNMTPQLGEYLASISLREPAILAKIRIETASHPHAVMQISPDQGALFDMLVRLMGARRILEVGVFTGYSSTAFALALPADGQLVACELNEEYASVAQRYWAEAGVGGKIDLRLGPAQQTLTSLLDQGQQASFDLAFLDADKTGYEAYYELCLQLLRPGGLVVIDNVLWSGRVADPACNDPDTVALRAFNQKLHRDHRVDLVTLAVADGITLARLR